MTYDDDELACTGDWLWDRFLSRRFFFLSIQLDWGGFRGMVELEERISCLLFLLVLI